MSNIQPFCFEDTVVRTILRGDDPWFVAKDICDVLEVENVTKALYGLDEDELTLLKVRSGGQDREMNCISESGLYTLIIRSNKPQAKPFRKWVTAEVLPAIRRTGCYTLVTAKREKVVKVLHSHTKDNPHNPHGIRYHLDLTRIVSKPTRQSLELLTRLTGVDFSDIELSDAEGESEQHAWVNAFVTSCCQLDPSGKEGSTALYQAFTLWREASGFQLQATPSQRRFGLCLKARGDLLQKRFGDGIYYQGIVLKQEWRDQVALAGDQSTVDEVAA